MTPQAAAKELEEVMKRVREAQSFISAAIEPGRYILFVTEWTHSVCTFSKSIFYTFLQVFSDAGEGCPKVFSMCWGKKPK